MPYIWKDTDTEQPLNRAFKKGGLQYPRNWIIHASEDDRKAIGLEWVNDDYPKVNERYHRITGRRGDWTVKPRDLDELKAEAVVATKKHAGNRLAPTDWMVVRKVESGAVVPEDVAAFRAATRAYSNELEAVINAAADVDALIAVKQEWPKTEEEIQREAEAEAARLAAEERMNA
jgi:hypothetical protein